MYVYAICICVCNVYAPSRTTGVVETGPNADMAYGKRPRPGRKIKRERKTKKEEMDGIEIVREGRQANKKRKTGVHFYDNVDVQNKRKSF